MLMRLIIEEGLIIYSQRQNKHQQQQFTLYFYQQKVTLYRSSEKKLRYTKLANFSYS